MEVVTYPNCPCCGSSSSSSSSGCRGWFCCPETGEVVYLASCDDIAALGPCGGSSSSSESGTPCSECFGPGTPNPTDATPATLTATYVDQGGISDSFVNDGNWDYQCGDSVLDGILNASAHLCAYYCEVDVLCTALILNTGGAGPNETIRLTILSCSPFLAEGDSVTFGHVIVSE